MTRSVVRWLALASVVSLGVPLAAQDPAPTQPTFAEFLASVRADALLRGLREETVDAALATVTEPNTVVVARDRAQPERTRSLEEYIANWITTKTTATAAEMATHHAAVLAQAEKAYGVPGPLLLSIWGLESNFGRFTGSYPTVQALATLAYDPRRSKLFRNELLEALAILDRGVISVDEMKGSWAGAMGQPQFMPSTSTATAAPTSGSRMPTSSDRSAITSRPPAGSRTSAGAAKCASAGRRWTRSIASCRCAEPGAARYGN